MDFLPSVWSFLGGGSLSSGGIGQPGPQFPHLPWPPTWWPGGGQGSGGIISGFRKGSKTLDRGLDRAVRH